jgi:hypothetical protein
MDVLFRKVCWDASYDPQALESLFPAIAYKLSGSHGRMRSIIHQTIQADRTIIGKSPDAQLLHVIIEPFTVTPYLTTRLMGTVLLTPPFLLIIDGLDECNGDENQSLVVELIGRLVDHDYRIVRCLITSRPEPQILAAITLLKTTVTRVTLYEETWDLNRDIRTHLCSGFDEISARLPQHMFRPWPSDGILEALVQKAGGNVIYNSIVLRHVEDQDSLPANPLRDVLNLLPVPEPLDQLYQQILSDYYTRYHGSLLHILKFLFLRNPEMEKDFAIPAIEDSLGLDASEVTVILRRFHSILKIDATDSTVTFLHASFRAFCLIDIGLNRSS